MTKKIYLETLKSVLGRSILHYFCLHGNCCKKIDYFWKYCFQILVFDKWNSFKQEKESFKKKYKRA